MHNSTRHIGILGAGISGLSAAYALKKKGYEVTVYEKSNQPGGVIQTKNRDGWKLEAGPNTLLINSKEVSDFISELNLSDELVEANPAAKKRFIIKNREPIPVPLSVRDFLSTDLISLKAKLRLLKEPFVSAGDDEESIANFISRRLGSEPLHYAVNPFVSGVYAGDAKKLSIKHTFSSLYNMEQDHGSLLKGMLAKRKNNSIKRRLVSFQGGMQSLPKKLASEIGDSLKLDSTASKICRSDKKWELFTDDDSHMHDALISTIPAHTLARVFDTPQTQKLADIPYAPMSVLHLGFHRINIEHPLDGFGMLIPEVENYNMLGCLFSSTLFEQRAPEDHVLLTCFMGGARNPDLALKAKDELCDIAVRELNELIGVQSDPVFTNHTFWKHAIPQYELGYDFFLDTVNNVESENEGLFLGGNYRGGVSVPDCITNGLEMANRIEDHFNDKF